MELMSAVSAARDGGDPGGAPGGDTILLAHTLIVPVEDMESTERILRRMAGFAGVESVRLIRIDNRWRPRKARMGGWPPTLTLAVIVYRRK